MNIIKGKLIVIFSIVTFLLLSSCSAFRFFFGGMDNLPEGVFIKSFDSPDGKYTINGYISYTNATAANSIRCSVKNNETKDERNIYWQYHEEKIEVEWVNSKIAIINDVKLNVEKDTYNYEDYDSERVYKTYHLDLARYKRIREFPWIKYKEEPVLPLFPKTINNLEVDNFLCRCDLLYNGDGAIQLLLKAHYSDIDSFESEKVRISNIASNSDKYFKNIKLSVFANLIGKDSCSEYALIDEKNQTIYYIYVQNVPKDEIEFDNNMLPDGYTNYGDIQSTGKD